MRGESVIREQAKQVIDGMVLDFADTADDEGSNQVPLLVLVGIKEAQDLLEEARAQAVADARRRGPYSWEAIGQALGITKQAAMKRYSGE